MLNCIGMKRILTVLTTFFVLASPTFAIVDENKKIQISLEETINLAKECKLQHIAIIMDGNRRWAKQKNLPSVAGHNQGVVALKNTVRAMKDFKIQNLTVYAFSTENWKRSQKEVEFLMFLLGETLKNETQELHENDVRIRIIGDTQKLSPSLQEIIKKSEEKTANNKSLNLQIAINYGGRAEIVNAIKQIAKDIASNKISSDDISEDLVSKYLYTNYIPDPDLIIRTGGEYRISNYLLWQIAYSEFYITKMLWPDFDKEALRLAISDFAKRNRRFGKD